MNRRNILLRIEVIANLGNAIAVAIEQYRFKLPPFFCLCLNIIKQLLIILNTRINKNNFALNLLSCLRSLLTTTT